MPSAPIHFLTTVWSVIREAKADPAQALEHIVRRYRDPIYLYLRQRGLQDADAEDLVQDVFSRVCDESLQEVASLVGRELDWTEEQRRREVQDLLSNHQLDTAAP